MATPQARPGGLQELMGYIQKLRTLYSGASAIGNFGLSGLGVGAGLGGLAGFGANLAGYGRNQMNTSLGGTVGGALGNLVLPGVGGLVGAGLGTLVGGQLGARPTVGPNGNTVRQYAPKTAGFWSNVGSGADNGMQVGAVDQYGDAIQNVINRIAKDSGVTIAPQARFGTGFYGGQIMGHLYDPRTKTYLKGYEYNPDTGGVTLGEDPNAAAQKLVSAYLNNFASGTPEQMAAMRKALAANPVAVSGSPATGAGAGPTMPGTGFGPTMPPRRPAYRAPMALPMRSPGNIRLGAAQTLGRLSQIDGGLLG